MVLSGQLASSSTSSAPLALRRLWLTTRSFLQDISLPETSKRIVSAALTLSDRIDVLISNAGICVFSPFLTMPLETYKLTYVPLSESAPPLGSY